MKKAFFAVWCLLLAVSLPAQVYKSKKMYVCVKSLKVKSSTGFFASTIAELSYGDEITVIDESSKYAKVSIGGNKTGWVALSGLTKKQVIKNSNVNASQDEIALAGKGFTAEIESQYKKKSSYNYAAVDEVEKKSVSDAELKRFMQKRNMSTER
jgi:SH3 type 3 domain protein